MRAGREVCVAFYGHPGVFVEPSHAAMRRAREAGFEARMLPGVSAEDCLFADLGVDPAEAGCQSYEATDFLLRRRRFDPTAALILWQVAAVAVTTYTTGLHRRGLRVLADRLLEEYPAQHRVTLYEAAVFPFGEPLVDELPLELLADCDPRPLATLYVPPLEPRPADAETARRLGLL